MSRSHYSDDFGEDFPGQLDLYRANVDRAFHSRKGRAKLTELLAALDAMPTPALYPDVFIETRPTPTADPWPHLPPDDDARTPIVPPGGACALGAWAQATLGATAATLFDTAEPDSIAMAERLESLGWPRLVVHDIVFENDSDGTREIWRVHGPWTEAEARKAKLFGYPHGPVVYALDETPEHRWQRLRAFVARKLAEIEQSDARVAAWKAAHPYTTPSPAGVGLL